MGVDMRAIAAGQREARNMPKDRRLWELRTIVVVYGMGVLCAILYLLLREGINSYIFEY